MRLLPHNGEDPAATATAPRPTCGNCGYNLAGLPGEGACPECGSPYDPDHIVLAGWRAADLTNVVHAPPDQLNRAMFIGVFGVVAFALARFEKGRLSEGLWLLVFASVILTIRFARRWARGDVPEMPSCVQISPDGFAERRGFGSMPVSRWSTAETVSLNHGGAGRFRLRITKHTSLAGGVDFEFECNPSQAAHIRAAIDHFRNLK